MKKLLFKTSLFMTSLLATTTATFAITSPNVTVREPAVTDPKTIIDRVTTWVLGFAAAVAVLFIVYAGLQMVASAGNKDRYESAKKTLGYAVLGLIVIALALVIVKVVLNIPTSADITKY